MLSSTDMHVRGIFFHILPSQQQRSEKIERKDGTELQDFFGSNDNRLPQPGPVSDPLLLCVFASSAIHLGCNNHTLFKL